MLYCVGKYFGPIVRYRYRYIHYTLYLPGTIFEISRDLARDSQLCLAYSTYTPLFQLLLNGASNTGYAIIFVLSVALL